MPALADITAIVSGASTLPSPPTEWAHVPHFAGVLDPTWDLEVWSDVAATVTGLVLAGAVGKDLAIADVILTAVDTAADTVTKVAHGLSNGDGPVQVTTGGTLPAGIVAAKNYWLRKVDADKVSFYPTLADALADTNKVDITDVGSGTHTIVDTADTQRLRWMGYGLLGYLNDGAVDLTAENGYTVRVHHRPRALAYALIGSTTAAISAALSLVKPVK